VGGAETERCERRRECSRRELSLHNEAATASDLEVSKASIERVRDRIRIAVTVGVRVTSRRLAKEMPRSALRQQVSRCWLAEETRVGWS
jgi:hypothetical protein